MGVGQIPESGALDGRQRVGLPCLEPLENVTLVMTALAAGACLAGRAVAPPIAGADAAAVAAMTTAAAKPSMSARRLTRRHV